MADPQPVAVTDLEKANIAWMADHQRAYLESGGSEGHIVDMRHLGGHDFTTTLLLRTTGRISGATRINPLIYADIDGEVILIASRGGADVHPGWYRNIADSETVDIQIGPQAFRASWRILDGAARAIAWDAMVRNYPPFADYLTRTSRAFPIVALKPRERIGVFE